MIVRGVGLEQGGQEDVGNGVLGNPAEPVHLLVARLQATHVSTEPQRPCAHSETRVFEIGADVQGDTFVGLAARVLESQLPLVPIQPGDDGAGTARRVLTKFVARVRSESGHACGDYPTRLTHRALEDTLNYCFSVDGEIDRLTYTLFGKRLGLYVEAEVIPGQQWSVAVFAVVLRCRSDLPDWNFGNVEVPVFETYPRLRRIDERNEPDAVDRRRIRELFICFEHNFVAGHPGLRHLEGAVSHGIAKEFVDVAHGRPLDGHESRMGEYAREVV